MLRLHRTLKDDTVLIPLAEFEELIARHRKVEPVELIDTVIQNTGNEEKSNRALLGMDKGKVRMSDDFDATLRDDLLEEFYK